MKLPVITQPLFEVTIPSTKKTVSFRPFLVREEKILLIAQEGASTDILRAIKQIINNCIIDDINMKSLTTFDLEYLFLKLHAKSVNNIAKLSYRDKEDDKVYDFEINLDEIEVQFNENNNKQIKINDSTGIIMKYLSADITENMREFDNEIDLLNFFIVNSMDTIYDKDEIYRVEDFSEEEVTEFIDNLPPKTFDDIKKFFETIPTLEYTIKYKNSKGTDRLIELKSVKDFFMWG